MVEVRSIEGDRRYCEQATTSLKRLTTTNRLCITYSLMMTSCAYGYIDHNGELWRRWYALVCIISMANSTVAANTYRDYARLLEGKVYKVVGFANISTTVDSRRRVSYALVDMYVYTYSYMRKGSCWRDQKNSTSSLRTIVVLHL